MAEEVLRIMADVVLLLACFAIVMITAIIVAVWANRRATKAVAARNMHQINQAARSNPEGQEAVFESYLHRVNSAKTMEDLDRVQSDIHQLDKP